MDSEGKRSIKVFILGEDGSPSVFPLSANDTLSAAFRIVSVPRDCASTPGSFRPLPTPLFMSSDCCSQNSWFQKSQKRLQSGRIASGRLFSLFCKQTVKFGELRIQKRRNYSLISEADLPGMEKEQQVPEGQVLRDDGCVCPAPPPPPKVCKSKLPTCPYDPRFPNQNQTGHCYFSFIDYQRCARLLGEDYPGCLVFYKCYTSLCPRAWWERWFEQMEKGTFPRKIYPPKPIIRPDPVKMRNMCYDEDPDAPPDPC